MPYCPHCRYEYEAGQQVCADCGRELVAELPPVAPSRPSTSVRWVTVTNVPNAILGNLLVGQLKDVDIPSMLRRSTSADVGEWSHNDFVPHDLLVPDTLAAQARQYISSPPGSPYGGPGWSTIEGETALLDPLAPEPTDGWQRLPSESDYVRGRALRKTHGASAPWNAGDSTHWSDSDDEDEDDGPGTGGDWTRSRWVRAIAGLLFLATSLPWLVQLFRQLGDALNR